MGWLDMLNSTTNTTDHRTQNTAEIILSALLGEVCFKGR